MLKLLRNKKTAKKIWIALAVLILPAFLFWGMGSAIRNKETSDYAGTVLGRRVSLREYKEALDAVKNTAIIRFGADLSEAKEHLNMEKQAWERIALLWEAKKRKIKVEDADVIQTIESFPFFARNGAFQEKLYADSLRYTFRIQAREFEEEVRQNLILAKLFTQIASKVKLSDEDIRKEYHKLNQEISIYYIAGLPLNFAGELRPSGQVLKEYFNKNRIQFKQPLCFNLEYVTLNSEEKTRHTLALLRKNKDLAATAKEANLKIKETGLFSQDETIPEIGWQPQIVELAAKAEAGQFLQPLQIDKQFFILRLKDKKEAFIPAFDAIKEKVQEAYIKTTSRTLAQEKIGECLKKLNELAATQPKTIEFAKISGHYGLKYGETAPFVFGTYIEGIGASDELWLKANELNENNFSSIINQPTGFFIIRLKSRGVINEQKFEKERLEFAKKILLQKENETFASFLEELFKNAQQ